VPEPGSPIAVLQEAGKIPPPLLLSSGGKYPYPSNHSGNSQAWAFQRQLHQFRRAVLDDIYLFFPDLEAAKLPFSCVLEEAFPRFMQRCRVENKFFPCRCRGETVAEKALKRVFGLY
jgi:hypothetical protein